MADISKIRIIDGTTYDLLDPEAAREAVLGGLKFSLDNLNKLLISKNNTTITAASNTTLAELAEAVDDLAELWEHAAMGVYE